MNVGSDSNDSVQSTLVTSKYFAKTNGMDDSLIDFKQTKNNVIGPKTHSKVKPKQVRKKIKGQKDIRTILKTKKSELIKYSEEFENVCKKSGVDVDAEQLQLAIALSKSLENDDEPVNTNNKVNAQARTNKIRATLKEYGFKIPETKAPQKKVKKQKKQYKLLLKTETEKQQIISDRYSQVLLQNFSVTKVNSVSNTLNHLYHIATNIPFDALKDNNLFYTDLVERSNSSGCLLKDYACIPGRPASPELVVECKMNFSEIECSQDELDVVLSGTIKSAKNVFNKKLNNLNSKGYEETSKKSINSLNTKCYPEKAENITCLDECNKLQISINLENTNLINNDLKKNEIDTKTTNIKYRNNEDSNKSIQIITLKVDEISNKNTEEPQLLETPSKEYRCYSPDIFDDEISITDNVKINNVTQNITEQEKTSRKSAKDIKNKELKDNINFTPEICNSTIRNPSLCIENVSHKSDTKASDFMDLTECVSSNRNATWTRQPNMQLSQNEKTKRKSNDDMEITECVSAKSIENIDLTQNKYVTDRITQMSNASLDLTQSSNSSDELPFVYLNNSQSLDKTLLSNQKEYLKPNTNSTGEDNEVYECNDNQNSERKSDELIFEDFVLDHSESSKESIVDDIHTGIGKKISKLYNNTVEHFDLVQSSSKSDGLDIEKINIAKNICNNVFTSNVTITERTDVNIPSKCEDITKVKITYDVDLKNMICNKDLEIFKTIANDSKDIIQLNFLKETANEVSYESKHAENPNDMDHCKVINEEEPPTNHIDLTQSSDSEVENNEKKFLERKKLENSDTCLVENVNNPVPCLDKDDEHVDLDLTQNYNTPRKSNSFSNSQKNNIISKNTEVSIDYDEIYDETQKREVNVSTNEFSNHCSIIHGTEGSNDKEVNCSQNSGVFEISDNELDYSLQKSRHENFEIGGLSLINNISNTLKMDTNTETVKSISDDEFLPQVTVKDRQPNNLIGTEKKNTYEILPESTPPSLKNAIGMQTPKNSEYIIKFTDVTPMLDYASLTTPERNQELDKYGMKPLKRKRAIQMLTYIYNQTHPIIEACSSEHLASPSKKPCTSNSRLKSPRKLLHPDSIAVSPQKDIETSENVCGSSSPKKRCSASPKKSRTPKKLTKPAPITPKKGPKSPGKAEISNNSFTDALYEVTTEAPCIQNIECENDHWFFQKREKAKVQSCRVPLHIAFHNYVFSRKHLREAILRYEPVNIDVIHKELVSYGHRYDSKDLLKFMDKKCITVKTSDNNERNRKL